MIVLALASAFVVAANASEALLEAARQNDVNKVQKLLDNNVDVNHDDFNKLDVNHGDFFGRTALHLAAKNNHSEAVTKLVDAEANVDAEDKYGQTALHFAAMRGHDEVVTKLIDAGADKHPENNNGYTALSFASRNGHDDVVAILNKTVSTPGPTTNPTQAASDNCDSKIFQRYAETSFMVKTKDEAKKLIAKVKKAFKAIKESYRAAKFNLRQLGREAKE
jgi:ankyrin repeat protein